jgi:trimethylamine--corrinoid protein Co-methyltransferase
LTDDEVYEIHLATIEVLEKTGVYVEDPTAREIFYSAGATVDETRSVVKIPGYVLEDAIRTTPKKLILHGRHPKHDFLMENNRVGFTCFGEGVKVIDPYTRELRTSTKKDVGDSALLSDYLDQVDIAERALGAHDVPEETAGIHNAEAILNNTTKHCAVNPQSGRLVQTMVDMGAAIMGGKDKLKERPILTMNTAAVAPLKLPQQCCGITIESAKAGLPVNIMSMAMAGASAPVHLAGALVVRNAESLAVAVLSQLTAKGAPIIFGDSSGCMDMRTGIHSVGAPEAALMAAAAAKLARLYGFPSWVAGG